MEFHDTWVLSPTDTGMSQSSYQYVGPVKIRETARSQHSGTRIETRDELQYWLMAAQAERTVQRTWIATYTIGLDGHLYLASRRSEHVACAAGGPVLSAGEITIDDDMVVVEITNQSTGFCPEPESWRFAAPALDHIGLAHPGRFTTEILFRLCTGCGERNIVKDS